MGSKKRARTCATTPKKRKRSARVAAQQSTQQSTLPELPCVLWHKIFREVAAADKSVETLARLRLVNKTTARDFEFKIFSEQIGRLFDDAAQKRRDAYQQWLQDNNLSHHDPGGSWLRVRECPLCHPTNNKMENMFKLHLSKATGGYHCFRCGSKGSYQHFKHRLQMLRQHGVDVGCEPSLLLRKEAVAGNVPKPHAAETEKWRQRLSESTAVQQYLQELNI